jgi:bacterioferritin-associated ferredoxin
MLKAMFNISMYVCCCFAVTDSEIEAHIVAGAGTLEAVMSCTRAGTRCGSCRSEIVDLIASKSLAPKSVGVAAPFSQPGAVATAVENEGLPLRPSSLPRRADDGRFHLAVAPSDERPARASAGDFAEVDGSHERFHEPRPEMAAAKVSSCGERDEGNRSDSTFSEVATEQHQDRASAA